MREKTPNGRSDFREMIDGDHFYYRDKSLFIEDVLKSESKVIVINRPRIFGKTLNLSMLKYFFSIEGREKNRALFNNLKIENSQYMSHFGKYPVIHFSMFWVGAFASGNFGRSINRNITSIFNEFDFLNKSLQGEDLIKFNDIWLHKEVDCSDALEFLARLLYEYYGVKPIILIDEYDSPYAVAKDENYYDEAKEVLEKFYSKTLKNEYFTFALLMGSIKISDEKIFGDIDKLDVSTVLDGKYNYFGINENEVIEMLKFYNKEEYFKDVEAWYGGYLFGNEKIYNNYSFSHFLMKGRTQEFWRNSSKYVLIRDNIGCAGMKVYPLLEKLSKGEEIITELESEFLIGEHYSEKALLSLMVQSGNLSIRERLENNKYKVGLPNKELKSYFGKQFLLLAKPEEKKTNIRW